MYFSIRSELLAPLEAYVTAAADTPRSLATSDNEEPFSLKAIFTYSCSLWIALIRANLS
jgi:hypothetical protein